MKSVKFPTGLIRYTSQNALEGKKAFRLTPRITGYGLLFTVLLSIVAILIAARSDIDGAVKNLYNISVVNKTFEDLKLRLRLKDLPGEIQYVGSGLSVSAGGKAEGVFFIVIPRANLYSENSLVEIEVLGEGRVMQKLTTSFSGPKPSGAGRGDKGERESISKRVMKNRDLNYRRGRG
jgi:hypothetical protein